LNIDFFIWLIVVIIIAAIAITIIKKIIKAALSIAVIAIVALVIIIVLINQDLKTLDSSTMVLQRDNITLAIVKEGKLLPAAPEGRTLTFDEKDFPKSDEKTFANDMAEKLNGTEKQKQKYLFDNAESNPETIAYKLKPITTILLKR